MTNKTISLTIPNDDPIALHEFGAAMQRMAGRHGLEVPRAVVERETHTVGDLSHTVERVLVDTDKAQLAALGADSDSFKVKLDAIEREIEDRTVAALGDTTPSHLDSDGLPWDARIHASSKERNADDTWRARRKPSDMDAGQWAEFQGQVRTELRALMELPVEQEVATVLEYSGEQPDLKCNTVAIEEDGTLSVSTAGVVTPTIVVEPIEPEPIVVTPPAPVEPVAPPVAPPAHVDPVAPPAPTGTAPTEFVPFLQWITSSGITPEQVNVALAQHGLTAVPQLQQRPDLIPQVHATLAAGV